jgi:hypothetical protein
MESHTDKTGLFRYRIEYESAIGPKGTKRIQPLCSASGLWEVII